MSKEIKFSKLSMMESSNYAANHLASEAAKNTEEIILQQLNDLVSRGLLVIQSTQPALTQFINEKGDVEMRIDQVVKLTLKDQEYIQRLETENFDLRLQLDLVEKALRGGK